jgi:hypothetical protein
MKHFKNTTVTFYSTSSTCNATGKWLRQIQSTIETNGHTHNVEQKTMAQVRMGPSICCSCSRWPVFGQAETDFLVVFVFTCKKMSGGKMFRGRLAH